jgi:energy-coupling factor transporter ATP-binding protein EcfA2
MAEIRLRGVRFAYPGGRDVFAGEGLTLDVAQGPAAIVGENGAGKTTLTKLLNGLLRPATGTIEVAGVTVTWRTAAQMAAVVGYSFQNPDDALFERTVRAEVAFGPRAMGRRGAAVQEPVARALEACGLTEVAGVHPYDLNLARRKWVTIATALAADPPVVVLDEPTLGQDQPARARLAALVGRLAADRKLVLLVTHDMDFVADTCPWTVMLSRGRLEYAGPTAAAFDDRDRLRRCGLTLPRSARLAAALGATTLPIGEAAFTRWWSARTPS